MSFSPRARQMLKDFEGRRGQAALQDYDSKDGAYTIGWGHKLRTGEMFVPPISVGEAETLLSRDIAWAERAVNDLVTAPLRQHEFDALVDFVFNSGRGTFYNSPLREHINNNDVVTVADFTRHNPGGQVGRGVDTRKSAEATLFFHGRY